MGNGNSKSDLSHFRKQKLLHEYYTFFDMNHDDTLEWKDFDLARQQVCKACGWKTSEAKFVKTQEVFIQIWSHLTEVADDNFDDKISAGEWIDMWQTYNRKLYDETEKAKAEGRAPVTPLPDWLEKYIWYKYNMYDNKEKGAITCEEFTDILQQFNIPEDEAKTAFMMFSQNNEKKVDYTYFRELCKEYYLTDDPNALGNFITGKLIFEMEDPNKQK